MSSSFRPKVDRSAIETRFTTPLSALLAYLVLIKVLRQRLVDLRQPNLASLVSLHRFLDLRDELINVGLRT